MEFREASDIFFGGPSVTQFAAAAGVSLNSISRARMVDGKDSRPAPKEWRRIMREMAAERAAALSSLASELADA